MWEAENQPSKLPVLWSIINWIDIKNASPLAYPANVASYRPSHKKCVITIATAGSNASLARSQTHAVVMTLCLTPDQHIPTTLHCAICPSAGTAPPVLYYPTLPVSCATAMPSSIYMPETNSLPGIDVQIQPAAGNSMVHFLVILKKTAHMTRQMPPDTSGSGRKFPPRPWLLHTVSSLK